MGVMEHFLLLVPGPLPGCIFMRHIILALNTVCLLHCKTKVSDFTVPSQDVTSQTLSGRKLFKAKLSLARNNTATL
jgi:hypothetical protein